MHERRSVPGVYARLALCGARVGVRLIAQSMFMCGAALVAGCGGDVPDHGHDTGANGGIVVSVGPDHFHVEALFVDGEMRLYTLGQDQTQIVAVPLQELTAYVRSRDSVKAATVTLKPAPQAGDNKGETSCFVGRLPDSLVGKEVLVTVPLIQIAGARYRFGFMAAAGDRDHAMPSKVVDSAEAELYLTPGGKYTQADVIANGSRTASDKYRDFQSAHDFSPKAGDRICPITKTKANAKCVWIVGGQQYEFCCPPCIDEFVKRAKTEPDTIRPPEEYVKD